MSEFGDLPIRKEAFLVRSTDVCLPSDSQTGSNRLSNFGAQAHFGTEMSQMAVRGFSDDMVTPVLCVKRAVDRPSSRNGRAIVRSVELSAERVLLKDSAARACDVNARNEHACERK
jgi:hypothetical protein